MFGDFIYKYPEDGYMILTNEDRRQAISRLEPFFNKFKQIAMLGNIIYLGYSFEDQLVFELLSDLAFSWKRLPWKGYAISPNEPSKEKLQHLSKFNVEWVEGDVSKLVIELKKHFGNIPKSHTMENKMMILDNIGFARAPGLPRSCETESIRSSPASVTVKPFSSVYSCPSEFQTVTL